jgi:hypothetical protein
MSNQRRVSIVPVVDEDGVQVCNVVIDGAGNPHRVTATAMPPPNQPNANGDVFPQQAVYEAIEDYLREHSDSNIRHVVEGNSEEDVADIRTARMQVETKAESEPQPLIGRWGWIRPVPREDRNKLGGDHGLLKDFRGWRARILDVYREPVSEENIARLAWRQTYRFLVEIFPETAEQLLEAEQWSATNVIEIRSMDFVMKDTRSDEDAGPKNMQTDIDARDLENGDYRPLDLGN